MLANIIQFIQQHWGKITLTILSAITLLSLWPASQLPSVPGTDKSHHFIAYAALVFPVALRQPKNLVWLIIGFIVFSGMIELIQPFVNRYGEWLDLAANSLGLLFGCLLATIVRYFFLKSQPH